MQENEKLHYEGKIVQLIVPGYHDGKFVIENTRFENIGGKVFIIGRCPPKISLPRPVDVEIAIAWDHVEIFQTFKSCEEFVLLANSDRAQRKKRRRLYRRILRWIFDE